jgi:hypothetical protein
MTVYVVLYDKNYYATNNIPLGIVIGVYATKEAADATIMALGMVRDSGELYIVEQRVQGL